MQAIFSGRAPQCSGWTPGGATASVTPQNIADANTLLAQIKAFVGEPTDFATGTPGTMMFDVVAAAHLFPEYFWIGNSYSNFMAFGWGEEAGTIPLTGVLGSIFTQISNTDNRASLRGWKTSAVAGAPVNAVDIMKIGESIAGSRYNKTLAGKYLDGSSFKHPWDGMTQPKPLNEYSWLKSPRYDVGAGNRLTDLHDVNSIPCVSWVSRYGTRSPASCRSPVVTCGVRHKPTEDCPKIPCERNLSGFFTPAECHEF